ncbi:MAG TPA: short chain dehydrogenase [Vicinamibacteria bacterium]|nr:short chain dehydrogenase [Vicinamibacteria bacterium]
MKILVVGATGTIGRAIVAAFSSRHEIIQASRKSTPLKVDLAVPAQIRAMYAAVRKVDAVVCAAGEAKFAPFASLTDEDFEFSLHSKLMGQVNLIRYGLDNVRDGGCFVLTSGILAAEPMAGSGAVSLVNAGLEGFMRAAALEAPRRIRVNVVSPPWVTETMKALGMDPKGGLPAATLAQSYVQAVEAGQTGQVFRPTARS